MNLSIIFIILLGAIPNILKKSLLKELSLSEYFVSFTICMSILTFGLFCYKTYVEKEKIKFGNVFNSSVFPIFALVVLLKFFSIYKKLGYLQSMDISNYYPIFKSLSIVITIILGVVFLKETKTIKEISGCILVVLGVLLLNGVSSPKSGSS